MKCLLAVLAFATAATAVARPHNLATRQSVSVNPQIAADALTSFGNRLNALATSFNQLQTALGTSGFAGAGAGATAVNENLGVIGSSMGQIQNATSSISGAISSSGNTAAGDDAEVGDALGV